MCRVSILLLLAVAAPALAHAAPYPAPPVDDPDLATMRGGFRLPGGLDVALAVQTETSINGALVLRSVFRAAAGAPELSVAVPGEGQTIATTRNAASAGAGGVAQASYDSRSGRITVTQTAPMPAVNVSSGGTTMPANAGSDGLRTVDASSGPVETAVGVVSVQPLGDGSRVRLQGDNIDVSHLFGNAIGAAVANAANDRAIDTATTVSLDIGNASPTLVGSALLRVDAIALESVRLLTR